MHRDTSEESCNPTGDNGLEKDNQNLIYHQTEGKFPILYFLLVVSSLDSKETWDSQLQTKCRTKSGKENPLVLIWGLRMFHPFSPFLTGTHSQGSGVVMELVVRPAPKTLREN
jgi:hypothetical protein